jgi:hypothetical protein
VKACSGMVSRWALDTRRPEDNMLVYMDDETFAKATDKKVLCTERVYYDRPATYRRQIFGHFFLRYAIAKGLDGISPSTVDQFLDTKDNLRKRELGNLILKEALRTQIEPMMPLHSQMVRQGNVQQGKPESVVTSIRKLIPQETLPLYYPILTKSLRAA